MGTKPVQRAARWNRAPAARERFSYFVSRCYAEGLSKATVAHLAGADRGLAAERAHAARALPRGVVRGLLDAVRGDAAGAFRAMFIVVGLAVTALPLIAVAVVWRRRARE